MLLMQRLFRELYRIDLTRNTFSAQNASNAVWQPGPPGPNGEYLRPKRFPQPFAMTEREVGIEEGTERRRQSGGERNNRGEEGNGEKRRKLCTQLFSK